MLYVQHRPSAVVVRPSGDLDAANAPILRQVVAQVADGQDVIVDLSEVSFVDPASLGAIAAAVRRVTAAGGRASIVCARPGLREVLASNGIDRLVRIIPEGADAVAV